MFTTGPDSFIVKTSFNDKPVAVRGCGPEYCSLSQFLNLLKN